MTNKNSIFEPIDYLFARVSAGNRYEIKLPEISKNSNFEREHYIEVCSSFLKNLDFVFSVEVASPSLVETWKRAANHDNHLKTKKLRSAALSGLRYQQRMRTRPTLFGVFSGVANTQ